MVTRPEPKSAPTGPRIGVSSKAMRSALARKDWELRLLREVRAAVAGQPNLHAITTRIVESVAEAFGYTQVSVYLLDGDVLELQHQVGYDSVISRIPRTRGVVGRVVRTGQPVYLPDVTADPDFLAAIEGIASEVCVPLCADNEIVGILNVESIHGQRLTEDDFALLQEVAAFLNLALERSNLWETKEETEQRLRLALDATGIGIWEWDVASNTFTWSEQMGPLFGLSAEPRVLSGHDWLVTIHPDDHVAVTAVARELIFQADEYDIEYRPKPAGNEERWIFSRGRVIERSLDGKPVRIIGTSSDITDRKRLEAERLRLAQAEAARAHAEAAERQITETLERLSAGFLAIDITRWRLTFANSYAATLLGRPDRDLVGCPVDQVFSSTGEPDLSRVLWEAAAQQAVTALDLALPDREKTLEVQIYPSPGGLSVYLQDVTERREAERQRRLVEDRFRSLVQNASDFVLILDRQAVVQYASPAIERVLGVHPDEVVGSNNAERVHPADARKLRRAFVEVARRPGLGSPVVLRFRHRDGSYRWLEVTGTNLFHDQAIAGIVVNCRDITERRQAEFNLWLIAELSSALSTSLDVPVIVETLGCLVTRHIADVFRVDLLDDSGRLNDSIVVASEPEIERRFAQYRVDHPRDLATPSGAISVFTTGHALVWESLTEESWHADSPSFRPAEMLAAGVKSAMMVRLQARETSLGILTIGSMEPGRHGRSDVALIEEIARRAALALDNARLYSSATDAVAARDAFLSVAAHELRTPITAITGFATLLGRAVAAGGDRDKVNRYVDQIDFAGHRMSDLVDDMLDVSRIRLGQLPLRIGDVDLTELILHLTGRFEEQLARDRHSLSVDLPSEVCLIEGDEDRLEQVLSNLLNNAVKYSPEGGEITVTLSPEGDGYGIAIADPGIGLAAGNLELIFSPFGRAPNAQASDIPGLGIGLSIASSIVHRHGGRIQAESPGEGLGATMRLWLPRRQATDAGEDATPE